MVGGKDGQRTRPSARSPPAEVLTQLPKKRRQQVFLSLDDAARKELHGLTGEGTPVSAPWLYSNGCTAEPASSEEVSTCG